TLFFTFQKDILALDSISAKRELHKFKKKNSNNDEIVLFADLLMGMYFSGSKEGNHDKSIQLFEKIIFKLEAKKKLSPFEKNVLAIAYQSQAGIYVLHKPNKERFALRYYLKAEQLFNEIGYKKSIGGFQALSSFGEFYFRMKEY